MQKWEYIRYEFNITNQFISWNKLYKLTEHGWRIKFADPYLINFVLERRISRLRKLKTYLKDRLKGE